MPQYDKAPATGGAQPSQTSAARYNSKASEREAVLSRGRRCASLTIPALLPPDGHTQQNQFNAPWQSLGAMGVKALGSKIVQALVPANTTFFRYLLGNDAQEKIKQQDPKLVTEVEKGLQEIERKVQRLFEGRMYRPKFLEAVNQLIVAGNTLFYAKAKSMPKVYKLDSYVVTRDAYGKWLELVVKERVAVATLEQDVRIACNVPEPTERDQFSSHVDVFTCVYLEGERYYQHQELNGFRVPGSDADYPLDSCPWLPLRMYSVDGEDYGRSYVEEYIGDLAAYEALSQALTENAKASSRVLFGIPPTLRLDPATLARKPNLSFVVGDLSKVTTLRLDKNSDLSVARAHSEELKNSLMRVFLLNSSVQRNAERVTATEVEYMARELENMVGGIYSLLSDEFLLPLVKVFLGELAKDGIAPKLPADMAQPVAITGLAALGRGNELDKLMTYLKFLGDMQLMNTVNTTEASGRVALAIGIDTQGLVKTQAEIQAEQQQAMAQQLAMQAAPAVAQAAVAPPVSP